MPIERESQSFKDISMTFQVNPLNSDLIAIKNEVAISRSIRNIVFTSPGERFFNEGIGYGVNNSLFENMDEGYAKIVEDDIRRSIINYEPRVKLKDVLVEPIYDENSFNVTIKYDIIGVDMPTQQLTFVLQPTR